MIKWECENGGGHRVHISKWAGLKVVGREKNICPSFTQPLCSTPRREFSYSRAALC